VMNASTKCQKRRCRETTVTSLIRFDTFVHLRRRYAGALPEFWFDRRFCSGAKWGILIALPSKVTDLRRRSWPNGVIILHVHPHASLLVMLLLVVLLDD
jgi:hypothetical protein